MTPNREPIRPCCTGREETPAALAGAHPDQSELLRQCIASGQVSAAQAVAHHAAGELDRQKLDPWAGWSDEERVAAMRRAF